MNRFTFRKCETNFPAWFIAHRGYEPQIYQILHDHHVVGWLTDQYDLKNNWRIFPKFGGHQIQPWDIRTVKPLAEVMEYIQTLSGAEFTRTDTYVFVEIMTEYGMTMYVHEDSGRYYLAGRPQFLLRSKIEHVNFSKELNNTYCTLEGDRIKSIETKSVPVIV